jgi:hypothetical protein
MRLPVFKFKAEKHKSELALLHLEKNGFIFINNILQKDIEKTIFFKSEQVNHNYNIALYIGNFKNIPKVRLIKNKYQGDVFIRTDFYMEPYLYYSYYPNLPIKHGVIELKKYYPINSDEVVAPDNRLREVFLELRSFFSGKIDL